MRETSLLKLDRVQFCKKFPEEENKTHNETNTSKLMLRMLKTNDAKSKSKTVPASI